jgi:hypothetical protein
MLWKDERLGKTVRIPVTTANLDAVVAPKSIAHVLVQRGFARDCTQHDTVWVKRISDGNGNLEIKILPAQGGRSDPPRDATGGTFWYATIEDYRPAIPAHRDEMSRQKFIEAACVDIFKVHSYVSGYTVFREEELNRSGRRY